MRGIKEKIAEGAEKKEIIFAEGDMIVPDSMQDAARRGYYF